MSARTGLTRDAVIVAAATIIDRDGWQRFSVAQLARTLGVSGPSIHHHIGSLDEVLSTVQVRAKAELSDRVQRAGVGRVGADGLRSLAEAQKRYAYEHPGLYELSQTVQIDPEQCRIAAEPSRAALVAIIESFGISNPSVELLLTCHATLHGVLVLHHSGTIARREDSDEVFRLATGLVVMLLESRRTPTA